MEDTNENIKLINAKREARRRRILENANSRLEKLGGKSGNSNENIKEVEPVIRNNSVTKTKLNTKHNIGNHNEDILQFFSNHGPVKFLDSTPQTFNNNTLDMHDQTSFSSKIIIKIVNFRLHLIALALISHIIYSKKLITISIFYPLLVLEIIDFLFLRKFQNFNSSSKLFSTLFLISGASSSLPFNSAKMISIMTVITNIIQDISIFLFVFINSSFLTLKVL